VIASRRGGNPEVIEDRVTGLLVPYPDSNALAAAIEHAFSPGIRQPLADASDDVLDRFRWPPFVERTSSVLEAAAQGSDLEPGQTRTQS
jgi:starch synthase